MVRDFKLSHSSFYVGFRDVLPLACESRLQGRVIRGRVLLPDAPSGPMCTGRRAPTVGTSMRHRELDAP